VVDESRRAGRTFTQDEVNAILARAVETVRAQLAQRAGSASKKSGARDAAPNVRIQPAVRAFAREPDERERERESQATKSTRRT
jgi:hypothetical protein